NGIRDPRLAANERHDVSGICHLRYPLRRYEAARLHRPQSCVRQSVDQLDLDCGGYRAFLVLQTVARAYVDNFHLCWIFHASIACSGSNSSSCAPSATCSPKEKYICLTNP